MAHTAEATLNVPPLSKTLRIISTVEGERTRLRAMVTSHNIPPVYASAWLDAPANADNKPLMRIAAMPDGQNLASLRSK